MRSRDGQRLQTLPIRGRGRTNSPALERRLQGNQQLWRPVDDEGEVLDPLVQRGRFKAAGNSENNANGRLSRAKSEVNLRPARHTVEAVPPKNEKAPIAATIAVDKPARNVRAYDREGKLLAYYPATMGSEEKPAPSGVYKVRGVTWNPEYHYYPKFAWKEVKTKQQLTVEAGPNNPVGVVWIDLTVPSYGIHGTPAPEDIGKTESHGCIRLTNWDAVDLAAMVRPGTVARFEDLDSPVAPAPVSVSQGRRPETRRQPP
jgi:lipoprotein-anchoring transpeptidase ErfK/SrfK